MGEGYVSLQGLHALLSSCNHKQGGEVRLGALHSLSVPGDA